MAGWDMERWRGSSRPGLRGLFKSAVVDSGDLIDQVVAILNSSGSFSRVVLEPRVGRVAPAINPEETRWR
jgi:hypothetical protein